MTKIIINATHKGGEGKTTNSIILAEYISSVLKLRTLAIDMDPQANFSGRYLNMEYDPAYKGGKIPPTHPAYDPEADKDWDGRSSIADIFYGEEVIPYPTFIPKLELFPAHSFKLQEAEAVTKNEVATKVHSQLKKLLNIQQLKDSYDAIIIDTPPSKGPLTIAAVKAASYIIIPAQMEQFSIEGIYGMLQLWKQETYCRGENEPLELVGILPNKMRNIKIHKQFLESLSNMKGIGNYVIPHVIHERAIYTEFLVENADPKILFDLSTDHIARQEYEIACKFMTKKVFNNG